MDVASVTNTSLFANNHSVALRDLRLVSCGTQLDLSTVPSDHVRTLFTCSYFVHGAVFGNKPSILFGFYNSLPPDPPSLTRFHCPFQAPTACKPSRRLYCVPEARR